MAPATQTEIKAFLANWQGDEKFRLEHVARYECVNVGPGQDVLFMVTGAGRLAIVPVEWHREVVDFVHAHVLGHAGPRAVFEYVKERVHGITVDFVARQLVCCPSCRTPFVDTPAGINRSRRTTVSPTPSVAHIQNHLPVLVPGIPSPELYVHVMVYPGMAREYAVLHFKGSKSCVVTALGLGNTPGQVVSHFLSLTGQKPGALVLAGPLKRRPLSELKAVALLTTGRPLQEAPLRGDMRLAVRSVQGDPERFPIDEFRTLGSGLTVKRLHALFQSHKGRIHRVSRIRRVR